MRARGGNKGAMEEVAIARVNTDMALKLPVNLHIKFAANRTGIAAAAGSQDASRCGIDSVLVALTPELSILREQC